MIINYKDADGHITDIEVTDEVGQFCISSEEQERKIDRRETRRHVPLSTLVYEDGQFFDSGIDIGEEIAQKDAMSRVMDNLSPRERFLITAVHIDGHTYSEIAKAEGKAVSTIERTTKRAADRLRHLYLREMRKGL